MESDALRDDPTGEYQRHQRKLQSKRRGSYLRGILNILVGSFGVLAVLAMLVYLLWTHATTWYSYLVVVLILVYSALMLRNGWYDIRYGRLPVTTHEVTQAKQQHRQSLQEEAKGNLPSEYSKGTRYIYLGCAILFGLAAGVTWYRYIGAQSGELLGYAIGHTIASLFAFLGFLNSLLGKVRQQQSAVELRRILRAGEFEGGIDQKAQSE